MNVELPAMYRALEALLESDARSATVYLDTKLRVTASHVHRPDSRRRSHMVSLTYGGFNWAGRLLAAKCARHGIPLPEEPQLRAWPKPRKKRRT